eukprot:GHVP01030602.1.p1 GENE.GHVP01030602.1~~GHVP01030602.1.p1  ORF type:complete len:253 (-),score=24.19 GHVP01030602.1:975-1733(-)
MIMSFLETKKLHKVEICTTSLFSTNSANEFLRHLQEIDELRFYSEQFMFDKVAIRMKNLHNLTQLKIESSRSFSESVLLQNFDSLEKLEVNFHESLSWNIMSCPKLRTVTFLLCDTRTLNTDFMISITKNAVENCPAIEIVNIDMQRIGFQSDIFPMDLARVVDIKNSVSYCIDLPKCLSSWSKFQIPSLVINLYDHLQDWLKKIGKHSHLIFSHDRYSRCTTEGRCFVKWKHPTSPGPRLDLLLCTNTRDS